jgi:F-type H+-transporting ATPase subunit b
MTLPIQPVLGLMRFAEEAEAETINPVLPVGYEIFWSAVFFFALWALMKFVLLPPIIEGREQRKAMVAAGQDSVSDSESELAKIRAAHEERLAVARAEASRIIDAARGEADGQKAQAVSAVEEQIAKLRANTQAEIDSARTKAFAGARGSVSELAIGAAGKVLGSSVDLAANQSVIDGFLNGQRS